jgi:hypothetical protein
LFRQKALEHCRDSECLTTRDAIALAAIIKKKPLRWAAEILHLWQLSLHAHLEEESQPCRTWVVANAEICGLRIAPPQDLEEAQRW